MIEQGGGRVLPKGTQLDPHGDAPAICTEPTPSPPHPPVLPRLPSAQRYDLIAVYLDPYRTGVGGRRYDIPVETPSPPPRSSCLT